MGHTEELSLEILLHGVVVAHEDVPAHGFVPRKRLRRRERLEPLVALPLFTFVTAGVVIAVVAPVLPVPAPALLPQLAPVLAPLDLGLPALQAREIADERIPQLLLPVNRRLAVPAVDGDVDPRTPDLPSVVEPVQVAQVRARAGPPELPPEVEPVEVARGDVVGQAERLVERVPQGIVAGAGVEVGIAVAVVVGAGGGDLATDPGVELAALLGDPGGEVVAPDGIVEGEVGEAELVAELPERLLVALHLRHGARRRRWRSEVLE